jgi:HEAT repeat protein
VIRSLFVLTIAVLPLTPSAGNPSLGQATQSRGAQDLIADLTTADAVVRTRAACGLRELGDGAAAAIEPLVSMLGDSAPVQSAVCGRHSWRGAPDDLTSPGEQAAAALVAIGTRAFQPVMGALRGPVWTARRNAAWALGAFDDQRAVAP